MALTRTHASAAMAVVAMVCWLVAIGEIPRWRWGGCLAVDHAPLPAAGRFPISLPHGAKVRIFGDSNSAGNRIGAGNAWPALLPRLFLDRITVTNHARGGSVAEDGLAMMPRARSADLCIVAFGSNDAAPRAGLSNRKPVALARYGNAIVAIARHCARMGAQVVVLAPPPPGSKAMERRIAPYRLAAREAALTAGAHFLDPAPAIAEGRGSGSDAAPALLYDAIHLGPDAHQRLARWISERIEVGR